MRQDFLERTLRGVHFGIVPPGINVVPHEPTQGSPRHNVAWEMLFGRQACSDHAACVAVSKELDPEFVMIFVCEYRR
jgi:hypothetical protein